MMTEDQKKVLKQIIKVFRENNIPYQITGGLAAIVYGAHRPLYDIDIDVHGSDIPKIRRFFKKNIFSDFHRLKDDQFDLSLMTLDIDGTKVDISQVEDAWVIQKDGQRIRMNTDIKKAVIVNFAGFDLPVQAKDELIEYKTFLSRPTDASDIQEMNLD